MEKTAEEMQTGLEKNKSVKRNAALNVIKTLMSLLFPLCTYSYAARILLPEGMGQFNYSNSIVSYFVLIAGLGVATYAIREGAKIRDQGNKIREFSNSMFSINVYATIIAYILLALIILLVPKLRPYAGTIALISLRIALSTYSVYWICSIYEEYFMQTLLTVVFQGLALVCLFIFVRTADDLNRYALITVMAYSGSGVAMHFYARKFVKFRFVLKPDLSHLKSILIIFSTTIATTIYVSSDVTILGWIAGDRYTGLYGASSNIYIVIKQLLNAVVAVVIPRFSFYQEKEKREEMQNLCEPVLNYMITICMPAMVGLFFFSKPIIIAFAGGRFIQAAESLRLLSIALIFAVFVNFFANCVLMAYRKEMTVMVATIISAGINILLNIILIPEFYDKAAAFTTIIAEVSMCLIVWRKSNELLKIRIQMRNMIPVAVGCMAVAGICILVLRLDANPVAELLIGVPASVLAYGVIQILMKNTLVKELLGKRGIKERQ